MYRSSNLIRLANVHFINFFFLGKQPVISLLSAIKRASIQLVVLTSHSPADNRSSTSAWHFPLIKRIACTAGPLWCCSVLPTQNSRRLLWDRLLIRVGCQDLGKLIARLVVVSDPRHDRTHALGIRLKQVDGCVGRYDVLVGYLSMLLCHKGLNRDVAIEAIAVLFRQRVRSSHHCQARVRPGWVQGLYRAGTK